MDMLKNMKMNKIKALCFGEVLIDQFPSGDKPGGAPMNVAYHLSNLGTSVALISCIGKDKLGEELMSFMNHIQVDTSLVQVHDKLPTGTVQVDDSNKTEASYNIVENVAWDAIQVPADFVNIDSLEYLIHGSLALRSRINQNSLDQLKKRLNVKVVFDLNLRPPFYTEELLLKYIGESHIIKFNQQEFNLIAGLLGVPANEIGLQKMQQKFPNVRIFLLTRGSKKAWAIDGESLVKSDIFKADLKDTVGAGDAFLGAFIHCISEGKSMKESIDFASATGAFVASQIGANPAY